MQLLLSYPHPNLPTLRATVEDPATGSGLVVMSPLGQDLHSYIRVSQRLPEFEAKALFRQLVSAVAHLHRLRVVLREIKLGKIFFSLEDRFATRA